MTEIYDLSRALSVDDSDVPYSAARMQVTQLVTTSEAAVELKCSPENVRRLVRVGQLPVYQIVGRGVRLFERSRVEQLAADRASAQSARSAA